MLKSVFVAVLLTTALMGCKTLPEASVKPPASLTQKCAEKMVELDGVTGEALLRNIVSNAKLYHECKDMHNSLVDALKDSGK